MAWADNTPKYDLHRHFSGSIPVQTVHRILRTNGSCLGLDDVTRRMVCDTHAIGFEPFLRKFDIFNEIEWGDFEIYEAVAGCCETLIADQLDYTEISLSIGKYLARGRYTPRNVLRLIRGAFTSVLLARNAAIKVKLLLAFKMESDRDQQRAVARILDDSEVAELVAGVDLVGDEGAFHSHFYHDVLRPWRDADKLIAIHAGETGPAANIAAAIDLLGAHRIRHGLAAIADPGVVSLARDACVCFDVSLHSSRATGVVRDMYAHPLAAMLQHGLEVTLGTDDPVIFGCTLQDEYDLALGLGLITPPQLLELRSNSITNSALGLGLIG